MRIAEQTAAQRPPARMLLMAATASLGGLLFGFDTAVIAGTTGDLSRQFHLTPLTLGITVSSALVGTIVGAGMTGMVSDRFGRRFSLRLLSILYLFSTLGCALAWAWIPLLFFRVMSGIAIGGSSVICPTYIAEIAPARFRGRMVSLFQLNVVLGMLLAYLSNYLIIVIQYSANTWRWELSAPAFPALLFFLAQFALPESPRWLMRQGRRDEAGRVLASIGETDEAWFDSGSESDRPSPSLLRVVFERRYRLPVFLAFSIGAFNQLSGVNAVLYYLNSIFESAGFSRVSSNLQAVFIGVTNLIGLLIAMLLIDSIGRKSLLLMGAVMTSACMAGIGGVMYAHRYQNLLLWLLVGFIGSFSLSQGAVIWVYVSEIFPSHIRGTGQSIGSMTHWGMNALVALLFPVAATASGSLPFFVFAAMTALQFFVVLFIYPETRGAQLETIATQLES